jgi:drug/metabolite transporter (DMT)-like permease
VTRHLPSVRDCSRSRHRTVTPSSASFSSMSDCVGVLSYEAWMVPSVGELFALIFASVFSLLGHLCVIYSLRSGEMAAVAPFRYAGIVWAILLGFLIWKELPDTLSLGGISILVSAGLYTLYREQQLRRRGPAL